MVISDNNCKATCFQYLGADRSWRDIDDSVEGRVITRIVDELEVGENVFDLSKNSGGIICTNTGTAI